MTAGGDARRRTRRLSLRDRAYEAVKDRIITCQFRPGECINEASVPALLGLGRTPAHQAIDGLMLEEMVHVIPRKGIIVMRAILQDVMQMIDVRMVNETQCALLAAVWAEQSQIQDLSTILANAPRAIDQRTAMQ